MVKSPGGVVSCELRGRVLVVDSGGMVTERVEGQQFEEKSLSKSRRLVKFRIVTVFKALLFSIKP